MSTEGTEGTETEGKSAREIVFDILDKFIEHDIEKDWAEIAYGVLLERFLKMEAESTLSVTDRINTIHVIYKSLIAKIFFDVLEILGLKEEDSVRIAKNFKKAIKIMIEEHELEEEDEKVIDGMPNDKLISRSLHILEDLNKE